MPDDYQSQLRADIADAELVADEQLAAEPRLELNAYLAAKRQAALDEPPPDER